MTTTAGRPDDIIGELHEIRERLVAEYDRDLLALTEAVNQRAAASGRGIIEKPSDSGVGRTERHRS